MSAIRVAAVDPTTNAIKAPSGNTSFGSNAGLSNTASDVIFIGTGAGTSNAGSNVTAVGDGSLFGNTGDYVVAVGKNAGLLNTASECIFVGDSTGASNTGSNTIAIGNSAGLNNTGERSVLVGTATGYSNAGSDVTAVGDHALFGNTGVYASAFGQNAGLLNTASECIFLGVNAGYSNSGFNTTAVGNFAGAHNTAEKCVFIGNQAGLSNAGEENIAIGVNCAQNAQLKSCILMGPYTGLSASTNLSGKSILIGSNTGQFSSGDSNIALGERALGNNVGNSVIAIGYLAGNNQNSVQGAVSNSIFLGSNPGPSNLNASGHVFMVYGAEYNAPPFLRGDISAKMLGIGCTPSYNLDVSGSANVSVSLMVSGLDVYSGINNLSSQVQNLSSYVYSISTGQWSLYPATQNVNLSGFGINNVTSLSGLSNINGIGVNMDSLGNIFLGISAGENYKNTTIGSIGVGALALQNVCGLFVNGIGGATSISCTGSYVDSMGVQAAAYNSGSFVVAIGLQAATCVSGELNLDGTLSGASSVLPGGNFVTAVGRSAASTNISDYVTAIGYRAATRNTGSHVVAIGNANFIPGTFAPAAGNTGNNVIAIGQTAGANNKGSDVIAIGRSAGHNNSGGNCVFLGQNTGSNNSGSNCVFLGLGAGIGNATANRFLVGNSNLLVGDIVTASLGVGTSTLSAKLNVGGTFLTTGLATLNSAQVTGNLSTATLSTTGLATLNSARVTTTLNVSGLTTLSAAVIQSNLSINTLNGATYPSTLGSTGQVLTISSTANTLYWASISNVAVNANMGNVARVDQIYGSDTLGAVGTYPYLTISKALSAVTTGQQVLIMPGTYNEGPLTIPASVSVRGANSTGTIIQMANVTTSVDMITMNSNTRLEDLTFNLTTSSTPFDSTYNLIKCTNGNSASVKIRTCVVNVFNYNPSGSAACFMSTGDSASVSNVMGADTFRGVTLNMTASGQRTGYSECIRVSGANRVSTRDAGIFLTGTNCSGATLICVETASAGVADLRSSLMSASGTSLTNCSLAEISQTNATSQIILSYSRIQNHLTNGKGFALEQAPSYLNYSLFGSGIGGNTFSNQLKNKAYIMLPGNTLITGALLSVSDVVGTLIEQDQVLTQVSFVANTSVSAPVTALVYPDTTLTNPMFSLTLSGSASNISNTSNTFKMTQGQQLVVQISGSSPGDYNSNLKSLQVNIGQF